MAETKTIEFIDAQEKHKQYPATFGAPNKRELNTLKAGDIVKVCCNDKERFWATIEKITQSVITAKVDNDLVYADEFGFDYEDTIRFEKRHIYSIYQ